LGASQESDPETVKNMSTRKERPKQTTSFVEAASLSSIDLFRDLPTSCLRALEKASTTQELEAKHVFFQPGEMGHVLFLLEKGSVETFRMYGAKKLIIAELKPPAIFGEMGCVGQCMYHCSAQTTSPSRIRVIRRTDLEALLQQYPQMTRRLLDLVSERFLHVLLDLEATSFRQLIPRIAGLLLARAEDGCVQNLTHREIAQHLRVYRESATAALGELRKAGIITMGRKEIRIVDRVRLERAARE